MTQENIYNTLFKSTNIIQKVSGIRGWAGVWGGGSLGTGSLLELLYFYIMQVLLKILTLWLLLFYSMAGVCIVSAFAFRSV